MKINILIALAMSLVIQSCGHLNKLSQNKLDDQLILFETIIKSNADPVQIVLNQTESDDKKNKSVVGSIVSTGETIGSAIVNITLQNKLEKAVKPALISKAVCQPIENTLVKYYNIIPTLNILDKYSFIVTTTINEIKLFSDPNGIFLTVDAFVSIHNRSNAEEIWNYCNTETVPLSNYFPNISDNQSKTKTVISNIFQLTDLAVLSEERIRTAIINAASEIGNKIEEVLLKDISKAK
jgi:hypothetical protein